MNVPPVWSQLPETVKVPDEPGAVRVPEEITTFVVLTKLLEAPVNVPPAIVNPPLKVCRAVEGVYVPPLIDVRPVTVTVLVLASNVPAVLVNVPFTVNEPIKNIVTLAVPPPVLLIITL